MTDENKVNSEVTLNTINERLNKIEKKIDKVPNKKENERFFIANLLISLSFVLISVCIAFEVQSFGHWPETFIIVIIPYFIIAFGLLYLSGKFLKKSK